MYRAIFQCLAHTIPLFAVASFIQIRLVVEEGLNCLPSFKLSVTTPTGNEHQSIHHIYCSFDQGFDYEGEWFEKNNCAVSILRSGKYDSCAGIELVPLHSGEAMEKGLRECCRSMRIGKILIRRDQETRQPRVSSVERVMCYHNYLLSVQVYYSKFPPSIEKRKILLLHPTLGMYVEDVCDTGDPLPNEPLKTTHLFFPLPL